MKILKLQTHIFHFFELEHEHGTTCSPSPALHQYANCAKPHGTKICKLTAGLMEYPFSAECSSFLKEGTIFPLLIKHKNNSNCLCSLLMLTRTILDVKSQLVLNISAAKTKSQCSLMLQTLRYEQICESYLTSVMNSVGGDGSNKSDDDDNDDDDSRLLYRLSCVN